MTKIIVNKKKINIKQNSTKIYPTLENLIVIPSGEQQIFNHPNSYGYDEVVVNAVETETLNIMPKEETQNFVGIYGEINVDKINTEEKSEELDFSNSDVIEVEPSENNYLKKVTINKDEDLLPENIKSGVNIFGVDGTGQMLDVEINDCSYLFYNGYRGDEVYEILKVCKNVTNCQNMFQYFHKMPVIDLSGFDTSKVTNMSNMFDNSNRITELNISTWDTSNVTNMGSIFNSCGGLKELDVSSFDTKNVTYMGSMFSNCYSLKTLILNNFNTSNVTNMASMFSNCSGLTELDVSSFDTSKVTYMSNLFNSNSKLTNLNISNFNAIKVTTVSNMFKSCTALTNLIFMNNLGMGYTSKSNNYSNYTLDLSTCNNLTHDSLMDVINKLYDLNLTYNVANGGTLYTQKLVLGATNMAKLSADEIAIATNKGWVVS